MESKKEVVYWVAVVLFSVFQITAAVYVISNHVGTPLIAGLEVSCMYFFFKTLRDRNFGRAKK